MNIREESILKALEQNWLHIRHIENGRLQFTYVYAGLTIGILTILESFDFEICINNPYSISLSLFLALLSLFGLFWTVKANLEIKNHKMKIRNFTNYFRIEAYMGHPTDFPFSIRSIFELFYCIVLSFWISFSLALLVPKISIPLFIVLFIHIYGLTTIGRRMAEQKLEDKNNKTLRTENKRR